MKANHEICVWMIQRVGPDGFDLDSIWPTKALAEAYKARIQEAEGGEAFVNPARPDLVVNAVIENKAQELRALLGKMGLVLAPEPEAPEPEAPEA